MIGNDIGDIDWGWWMHDVKVMREGGED